MSTDVRDDRVALISAALLAFYDAAARPLPWRATRDPYAIWVSEVMSQQTRVDTVVPYYRRWLARFPDVHALAAAPLDDVYKQWEGLGYYSRARNMHAAAALVRERHHGKVPGTYDELRALPGIGEYTAGAIASIAFGEQQPAIDGNVRRVLSRLFDEAAPTPKWLRHVAGTLVPPHRPGDFNQALMELGATVCTPAQPACATCPLRDVCAARAAGTQAQRPQRIRRKAIPTVIVATAVIHSPDGRVLLQRRPDDGLLAGMWSFPGRAVEDEADTASTVVEVAAALEVGAGDEPRLLGSVEHTFTHRRERYLCWAIAADPGDRAIAADARDHAIAADGSAAGARGLPIAWIGRDRGELTLPRGQQRIHALAARTLRLSAMTGVQG